MTLDYNRSEVSGFEPGTSSFRIPAEDTRVLKEAAKEEGATPFMVLLGIYYILLFKITSQEDIIVGTPIAGRGHADLEQIIGMFVNTLPLRNFPGTEKTFRGFIKEVKERTLESFENQDYPFETLVEKVADKRETGRNPLLDVMFSLQDIDQNHLETTGDPPDTPTPEQNAEPHQDRFGPGMSKFDMIVVGADLGEHFFLTIEYNKSLFNPLTIERYVKYFKEIVSAVVENNDIQLKHIRISHDLLKPGAVILQEDTGDFGF